MNLFIKFVRSYINSSENKSILCIKFVKCRKYIVFNGRNVWD